MPTSPDDLLSIGQAAAITGLSVDTLRRYDADETMPLTALRTPGGQRRFRRADVEALVSEAAS